MVAAGPAVCAGGVHYLSLLYHAQWLRNACKRNACEGEGLPESTSCIFAQECMHNGEGGGDGGGGGGGGGTT